MTEASVAITGWGGALPEAIVTNADWQARLDTSDEWIVERTGIRSRFVGGSTVELAVAAGPAAHELLGWSLGCQLEPDILNCELGGFMFMAGQEVFVRAVQLAAASAWEALRDGGVSACDVDVFIPHQANSRIMDALARRLGIPNERVASIIDYTGNTSSASIPLALAKFVDDGRIGPGDIVLLSAFGGGMTSASAVLKWGGVGDPAGRQRRAGP